MKIDVIGCTHGKHRIANPEPCDVVIHTGDATHGKFDKVGAWVLNPPEAEEFLDWFRAYPAKHHVLVPGNHDVGFDTPGFRALCKIRDIQLLIDEPTTIEGVHLYGTPYTPTFFDWAFMEPEGLLYERFLKIPEETDILITHGPAYGILDRTLEGENAGSKALLEVLNSRMPYYHLFSHIHEARGQLGVSSIVHMNVSFVDRGLRPYVSEMISLEM